MHGLGPLAIGSHAVPFPLIQGGMGVRVSAGNLAGHVARCGGVGLVATAALGLNSRHFKGRGLYGADVLAVKDEIRKAYAIAPNGVVGTNCMTALSDFDEVVRASCEAGAKLIVSGAGLPLGLPGLTAEFPDVALVPIVSSVRAAELIGRKWERGYGRLPDAVVVEDPDTAGGHLGERAENIGNGSYDQYATVRGVKELFRREWGVEIPVIAAGGIWDRSDLLAALEQGADAVQMATRFVCTEECDAHEDFKRAYLACRPEDIGLIQSPAGLPARGLTGNVARLGDEHRGDGLRCPVACLKKCTFRAEQDRFCIARALDRAQRGDVEHGLVFCGSNAWRAERIETVQEIFDELFGAAAPCEAVNA